jgi:hypothetical protein
MSYQPEVPVVVFKDATIYKSLYVDGIEEKTIDETSELLAS